MQLWTQVSPGVWYNHTGYCMVLEHSIVHDYYFYLILYTSARACANACARVRAHALLRGAYVQYWSTGQVISEYKHDFPLVPVKIGTNESSAPGLQNSAPGY